MYEIKYRDETDMKDSGVEWLGYIPKDWDVLKIGKLGNLSTSSVNKKTIDNEKKIKLLNYMDIYKKTIKGIDNSINFMEVTASRSQIANSRAINGDVFFTPSSETSDDIGHSSVVLEEIDNLLFSYHLVRLRFSKGLNINYKKYLFNNHFVLNQFSSKATGTTRMTLSKHDFSSTYISLPKFSIEQQKISNFLDYKTSQFDSIIEKKEKLIEKLEEAKKSLISEVVTGKVKIVDGKLVKRDESEMKDSGIKWLGKIPKAWVRSKLKNVLKEKIKDGPHETPDFQDEGIPFLSAEAIVDSKLSFEKKRGYITKEQFKVYKQKSKVNLHDILFCKSGSTTGKAALVETNEEFGIWSPLAIIRTNQKINYKLLFFFVQSKYFRIQVENYWSFGTQPNIGMDSLENLYVTFSKNKEEQKEIVDFLNKRTKNIEHSIKNNKKQINKIKQAKQSLISEAVTGKIDLRDWEIKL